MSKHIRWGTAVLISLVLLLLSVAAGLGNGQVQTSDNEVGPDLMPWQWANWGDMPDVVQFAWIHYLAWTVDRIALIGVFPGGATITSEPPAGTRRVESLYALMLPPEGMPYQDWRAEVSAAFRYCLEDEQGVCIGWGARWATAVDYSPFHIHYLQIMYYDVNGDYCGFFNWREPTGRITAHGCVPIPLAGGES